MSRRDPLLAGILLLAFALRAGYAHHCQDTPLAEALLLDSEFYDRQARALLAGQGWSEGAFFMNPLYPYLLALLYGLAGPGWGTAVGAQVVLGTANCGLIYVLGRRLWGREVGLLGAGLAAVCGVFIFYDGALLTATPILFLNLLGLNLLVCWQADGRERWLWLAGLCLGLSALARPLVLIWVALLGGWFSATGQWRPLGALMLGCALVLAPVMARNWVAGGEFALTTSSAGMNFYVGNHPGATGIYAQTDFVPSAEPDQEREGFVREAQRRLGHPVTPGQASAFWLGEGLAFIGREPVAYLYLLWRKFFLFWHEVESQNNLSYYFAQEWVPLLHLTPGWGFLVPLGLVGWVLGGRQQRVVALELYVLAYLLGCLVFFVSSEYRLPASQVFLLWGALGMVRARREWGAGRRQPVLVAGGVVLALALAVNWPDPLAERLHSMRVDYHNFAVLYERKGDLGRAREMARRCLEIDPGFAPAQQTVARLDALESGKLVDEDGEVAGGLRLYEEGEYRAAAEVFARLSARWPDQGRMHNSLGLCYYKLGEYDRAEAEYERALHLDQGHVAAHYNLSLLRLAQGRTVEAIPSLQRAVELDPQHRGARYRLGQVLARQGDRAGGLAAWEVLLAQQAGDSVLLAKVDSLRQVGAAR